MNTIIKVDTFPSTSVGYIETSLMFPSIQKQILERFGDDQNLLINLTWFGPQFGGEGWNRLQNLILSNEKFNRIFWIGLIDPATLSPELIDNIEKKLQVKEKYYIGQAFPGNQTFNGTSLMIHDHLPEYNVDDLKLSSIQFLYLNYNRRPKPHRIELVEKLVVNKLNNFGLVTLGKDDQPYSVSQGKSTNLFFKIENDAKSDDSVCGTGSFGGISHDVATLGRLDIWQKHFLNIVSESEFNPWDTTFVTEKTWKPIIGLRPFIINGQTDAYQWLRNNGFKTFNHYFNGIELENIKEYKVHDAVVEVVKYLTTVDKKEIMAMYNDMLPNLYYNRNRFFEFVEEQRYKLHHLFE